MISEIAKRHNLYHPPVIGFDGRDDEYQYRIRWAICIQAREKMEVDLKNLDVLGDVKMHSSVLKNMLQNAEEPWSHCQRSSGM